MECYGCVELLKKPKRSLMSSSAEDKFQHRYLCLALSHLSDSETLWSACAVQIFHSALECGCHFLSRISPDLADLTVSPALQVILTKGWATRAFTYGTNYVTILASLVVLVVHVSAFALILWGPSGFRLWMARHWRVIIFLIFSSSFLSLSSRLLFISFFVFISSHFVVPISSRPG